MEWKLQRFNATVYSSLDVATVLRHFDDTQ
jgi:hypothetical protein